MSTHNGIFSTLEPPSTPWNRFAASLAVNIGMVVALVLIPFAAQKSFTDSFPHDVTLVYSRPATPPPLVKITVPKSRPIPRARTEAPLPQPVVTARRLEPLVKPKELEVPKIEAPKVETAHVPEPALKTPAPPAPVPVKPSIKTNVFAAATPAPPGPKSPDRSIKIGGFGDPNGVPASASSTGKGLVVAQVGSFDLPQGDGKAGGGGHGPVAMAGFGAGGYDSSGASSKGSAGNPATVVRSAGFNDFQSAAPASKVDRNAAPTETPVEITYKPKPVYTAAAREKHLEGEVQVEVLFTAAGQVRVLRVIRGLGYGLDESARAAAEQIRFHPGTRDGAPVDMRGVVHITFELS